MADEGKLCVCPQCGKKYRLKAGFEAKSFSCKACGATVWLEGKPPAPAPTARKGPTVRSGRGRRGARAAAGRTAKRGRGRREAAQEAAAEGEEGRRGRYQSKPKSSANIIMAVAALALVGGIVMLFVMSGKDEPQEPTPVARQPSGQPGVPVVPALDPTQPGTPVVPPTVPANATPEQPAQPSDEDPEQPSDEEPSTPPRELGSTPTKRAPGTSRYDPPATLGHLETTPPELRKRIDEQVAILLDPQAGREVHEAKAMLAAIGKPAFPVVLGAMARVRDTLTDNDTMEERLIESSLMLADQCLREMDGYLDGHAKQPIRPGTDKKYVQYILRLHYKRWLNELQDMPEMPGAYDPSKEYSGEVEEEE